MNVLIGGDIFKSHSSHFWYDTPNHIELPATDCEVCEEMLVRLQQNNGAQLTIPTAIGPCRQPRTAPPIHFNSSLLPDHEELENSNVSDSEVDDSSQPDNKLQRVLEELKISVLNLTKELKQELVRVVEEHLGAFSANDDDVGCARGFQHKVNTGDNPPFKQRVRQLPFARREPIEKERNRL